MMGRILERKSMGKGMIAHKSKWGYSPKNLCQYRVFIPNSSKLVNAFIWNDDFKLNLH